MDQLIKQELRKLKVIYGYQRKVIYKTLCKVFPIMRYVCS